MEAPPVDRSHADGGSSRREARTRLAADRPGRVRGTGTVARSWPGAWEIWLPVVLALALTLPGLGQGSLVSDEALYAALSREILERWPALDLTLLGAPYGNKPPAGFWAMAASFATFGVNTFAARLPSALAGAACSGLVASLARRAFGRGAGFVAGISLALTLDWVRYVSEARLDSLAVALGLVGVRLCVASRDHEHARSTLHALAAGAAFGISALVKGPVVIAPLLVGLVLLRRPRAVVAALAAMLVVAGSWPLAMHFSTHGAAWRDLVAREVSAHLRVDGGRDISMLARAALIRGAPGSLLALGGLFLVLRRFPRQAWIASAWIVVVAICAVVPSPSYSRYALPLYPAFAFLAGGAFRAWLADHPVRLESILSKSRVVVACAALVAVALPLAFGLRVHRDAAQLFDVHRDELAREFPPETRVPLVGDRNCAHGGTVAFHLRRKIERMSLDAIDHAESGLGPASVLVHGTEARAGLEARGYLVAAVRGEWALVRRGSRVSLATPP